MFVQDSLFEPKLTIDDKFLNPRFLIMFTGVVIAPLLLLVLGGRDHTLLNQPSVFWPLSAIALFLVVSIGGGVFLSQRRNSHPSVRRQA